MTAIAALRTTIAASTVLVLALGSAAALAQNGVSNFTPSEKVSLATMSILAAPAVSVAASGHTDSAGAAAAGSVAVALGGAYVVSRIGQSAADGVEVVLDSVGSATKLSVKLAGRTVDAIGLSMGTTVQVVSETTGTLLVASGKVVAFVPNALGEALLSQKRLPPQ
jgi:hypothetical protein